MARNKDLFDQVFCSLKQHFQDDGVLDIRSHFSQDKDRFAKFSHSLNDLFIDFSKSAITDKTLTLLFDLAESADLETYKEKMFQGDILNITENRPVLHSALRLPEDAELVLKGHNIVKDIHSMFIHMAKFSEAVRSGEIKGSTNSVFTDIVNIGIGGSDIGPKMCISALKPYHDGPRCHYVSNLDSAHIADCLSDLNPETTLFIIASKTFITLETMENAQVARQWISDNLGEQAITKHFVAATSAGDKAMDFGIENNKIFHFWNWVGGRYSIWSSIGLSVMIAIGSEKFGEFLAGAHAMDEHFKEEPYRNNLPTLLGLIGYWNRVFCGFTSRAIVPYEQRLKEFPFYIQQLDMESNGKSVDLQGKKINKPTAPVTWGGVGTNGQHAFFQFLHQGFDVIPVEFIASLEGHEPNLSKRHMKLLSHCLAQSEAMLEGRSLEESIQKIIATGESEEKAKMLAAFKIFSGNRPSITIFQKKLTPYALGRLIALYEHRVFVEGVLMNVGSFDQWGVELGKELASKIFSDLTDKKVNNHYDSSTKGIVSFIRNYFNS